MALKASRGTIGKATTHVGPTIGRGKKAGSIGKSKGIYGSVLWRDAFADAESKVGYPTTTSTTTTSSTTTSSSSSSSSSSTTTTAP